ncbi:MAG: penicillin-binding protein 2 [Chloroflexota bacterium]
MTKLNTPTNNNTPLSTRRVRMLSYLLSFLLLACVLRLADWQIIRYNEIMQLVPKYDGDASHQPRSTRGMILDHNGMPLAMDVWGYQIFASPSGMGDEAARRRAAEQLAVVLKRPPNAIWEKLANPKATYVVLDYQAQLQVGEAIAARDIPGIGLKATPLRYYPAGAMAAQTIGFVNLSNTGLYGVEQLYHPYLNGETNECRATPTAAAQRISLGVRDFQPTPRACDLVLTLDWAIQDVVERELAAAVERTRATSGTIVVVEPSTGKILAMASSPAFDLNRFFESNDTLYNNPAVSLDYEPGSVVKIMTMAAGLDSGAFTPSSTMIDTGEIIVGGFKIHNWDNKGHGKVTMTDILAMSLNVGAAYISTSIGPAKFYEYANRFGFAKRTDVDLANETTGQMRQPSMSAWHFSDLGTNSYGQGMTMTPLQVAMMASAIANGGVLMKPYIVDAVVSQGQLHYNQPQPVRRVVSSDTAHQLATMLADAVEKESIPATIPTARIAGKTGTASIPNLRTGKYDLSSTIASFVGWAPYDDARFVILVKLDKPQTTDFGSQAAAPVFREIAKKLMTLLDVNAKVAVK